MTQSCVIGKLKHPIKVGDYVKTDKGNIGIVVDIRLNMFKEHMALIKYCFVKKKRVDMWWHPSRLSYISPEKYLKLALEV